MVLLDFTGSDWCGWCIKFDHDVLSTGQFTAYAKSKLVLVKLDYPRHKEQDAALKQANEQLSKRFGVNGFPTFVLLNSAGRELGRQVGYLKGGPDAFIAELDGFGRQ
jgi:protein disulfide-isomerase